MITINNHSLTLSDLKRKGLDISLLNYINNSEYIGSCPLYLREGDQFSLIKDCVISEHDITLLKPSFPNWLYRGGGVVNLTTKLGLIVRFDDRHNWWKPSTAGIADICDVGDTPEQILINSALRELSEEIEVIADQKMNILDQPKNIKFTVNEPDKAIEAVIDIDLSSYNIVNIIASEDDDIIPTIGVLNQKRIIGIYNQTQGYIDLQMVNVHPSVL